MKPLFIRLIVIALFVLGYCNHANALSVVISSTPFCNWDSMGTLTANITGGTAPYTYIWSDGSVGQSIINYPGSMCVTVTDANNVSATACSGSHYVAVVNAVIRTTPATCGLNNGSAWLDSLTGTPPFNIVWNSSIGGDTLQAQPSGNNFVQVTDSAGCILGPELPWGWGADSVAFVIGDSTTYAFNITSHPHHCPQLGSAAVHITGGGVSPFNYQWSTVPPQTTDSVGNLLGGTYSVTINDATNCAVTRVVNIANDLPINATSTSTAELCNLNNGTATIIPQSGVPPYTYLWNTVPQQATITATGLSVGSYQGTVLDANNCMRALSVYVGYTSPIQPNLVKTNEKCNNDSGTITLTPLLGTPPYSYAWSNGASASSVNQLSQGYYSVTVSDTSGCTVAVSAYIDNVPSYTVNITYTNTSCTSPTGSATAIVTGSTGPYTYRWSTSPIQTTQTATGLAVGMYTCTVTDANGCSGVYYTSIQYQSNINVNLYSSAALCNTATGSISNYPSGGTPPYTFNWSNGFVTQHISGVVAGGYYVTVTDVNGCSTVKGACVNKYSNMSLNVAPTNASCIYTNDGTATVLAFNAAQPVTYQWSNGQNGPTATGLSAGFQYRAYATDANGCQATSYPVSIGYQNLSCAAQVSGRVINDMDKDCTLTTGDVGIPNINVQAIPGYYDFTDANGAYSFILPPGNYALNHTLPYHTFQNCPVGPIVLMGLTAGQNSVDNDFFDTVRAANDLWTEATFLTVPRPGFNHIVYVHYGNSGNITMNPVIEFEYDSDETFVSTSVNSANYILDLANHKIIFSNFANGLLPGAGNQFQVVFNTDATIALGTDITNCTHITPVQNDVNFVNNDYCTSTPVVGSYDPNDKQVSPKGMTAQGFITRQDSFLHYTIRFQNTGTLYAENVVIVDTLDSDVNPGSVERIIASHNVRPDFLQNKHLAFYFDNIFLPDSTSDEPNSHGFVSFYVKQRPNLVNGTHIHNRAAIYFDYNAPIITNEVLNTIEVPNQIEEIAAPVVRLYPNPTSGLLNVEFDNATAGKLNLDIENLLGQRVIATTINVTTGFNRAQLSVTDLPGGMYLLNLHNGEQKFAVRRFLVGK